MNRLKTTVAALVLAGSAFAAGAAHAETIRLAHHHTVDGSIDRAAHVLAEEAARLTDGELEIQIFPAAQLGQQQEIYDQVDLGVIDMSMTPSSLIDKKWVAIRHADLPFLWESFEHFERAKNGEWGAAMVEGVLGSSNTRILGLGGFGFRDMIFRGEPVTDIAGLEGMKMRAPESRLWIRMFELLGARPTPVTWGEVYTAMQTGVAEGLESPAVAALDMKFDEVTESVVLTQHMFGILAIMINENRFQSLKPEFQEAILAAGKTAADHFDTETKKQIESAYQEMQEKGMTVVEPADRQEWVDAMAPLWDESKADHPDVGTLIDLVVSAK
jgi:tripartite ATP-independent transporter DctP family solute receptor